MGLYRFILSCIVVLFHFGNFPRVSGYSAVFGFYLLSGYLTGLTLDRIYSNTRNYLVNRMLRIYPLYLFYLFLLFAMVMISDGSVSFDIEGNNYTLVYLNKDMFIQFIHDLFFGFLDIKFRISTLSRYSFLYLLNRYPAFLGQCWSTAVEIAWWIVAPILYMSYKKYKKKILLIILGVSFIVPIWTAIAKLNFQAYRYRSFFCVLPIFIIGFCIYFFKTNQPKERKSKYIFLIFLYVSCMFIKPNEVSEVIIWILFIIQIVITIELSKLNMRRDTKSYKIDRYLGNLSYGIFLGKVLVHIYTLI